MSCVSCAFPHVRGCVSILVELVRLHYSLAATFVRMAIASNNGAGQVGFGEAAFEVSGSISAVPEPASPLTS